MEELYFCEVSHKIILAKLYLMKLSCFTVFSYQP